MQQDPLSIEVLPGKADDTQILKLSGPITLSNLFAFQDALRKQATPRTIIDLSGVPYMDSAGMGAVINFQISSSKNGRKLVLAGVNERCYTLLELTNTTKLLTLVPTVADAD
jgi:anti-sigma B factor antagonist